MNHSLQLSLLLGGACLTAAAGCQPAAKTTTGSQEPPAATSATAPAPERIAAAPKPVTAKRDERAVSSLTARPTAATRSGIGNLKRTATDAASAPIGPSPVEESKATSLLIRASDAAARRPDDADGMSSVKAAVSEDAAGEN